MRALIFGTVYADTPAKVDLAVKWGTLMRRLNPNCYLMLVDSASPCPVDCYGLQVHQLQLGDNIGHLSRGGRDGWGRAFCVGLQHAIRMGYDFVAHVEGDSLLRLPLEPTFRQMAEGGIRVASVPVRGTRHLEKQWLETGLMLMDVRWARMSGLVDKYDWRNGADKRYPHTPEWHLYQHCAGSLYMLPWSAERGDLGQITADNVGSYDWITHVTPAVSEVFYRDCLEPA